MKRYRNIRLGRHTMPFRPINEILSAGNTIRFWQPFTIGVISSAEVIRVGRAYVYVSWRDITLKVHKNNVLCTDAEYRVNGYPETDRSIEPVYDVARTITEETLGNMFADGTLKPEFFGLTTVEVRRFGACQPSPMSPCDHDDETCLMVQDVYSADDSVSTEPEHCGNTCPNLWDIGGETEGIGGEYADGGTFSYLSDDETLCNRVYARASEILSAG